VVVYVPEGSFPDLSAGPAAVKQLASAEGGSLREMYAGAPAPSAEPGKPAVRTIPRVAWESVRALLPQVVEFPEGKTEDGKPATVRYIRVEVPGAYHRPYQPMYQPPPCHGGADDDDDCVRVYYLKPGRLPPPADKDE
jgi:hypothetical protein